MCGRLAALRAKSVPWVRCREVGDKDFMLRRTAWQRQEATDKVLAAQDELADGRAAIRSRWARGAAQSSRHLVNVCHVRHWWPAAMCGCRGEGL